MNKLIGVFVFSLLAVYSYGQGDINKQIQLSDKVFFGGGFGMQFGSVSAVELSPMVGYKPVSQVYVGTKLTYQYYKVDRLNYATEIYGASIFGMYNFFMNAAIYTEIESLSLESKYFDTFNTYPNRNRFWVNSFLAGGGYVQPLGERSKLMVLLLFNFNETAYSPYSNPILRINFLY